MDPEIQRIIEAQERYDRLVEQLGAEAVLLMHGPRPVLPEGTAAGPGVFEGLWSGLKSSGYGTVAGLAGLADMAKVPGADALQERFNRALAAEREEFEGASGGARAGRVVGRLGGELAQAIIPAGLATKVARGVAATRNLPRLAKAAPWLGLGTEMGVEGVIEAGQTPEESLAAFLNADEQAQTPLGRAAVGSAVSGVLGLGAEMVPVLNRALPGGQARREAEAARAASIERALAEDREYQRILRKSRPKSNRTGTERYKDFATDSEAANRLSGLSRRNDPVSVQNQAAEAGRELAESGADPRRARPGVARETRLRMDVKLTPAQRSRLGVENLENVTLDEALSVRQKAVDALADPDISGVDRRVFTNVLGGLDRKMENLTGLTRAELDAKIAAGDTLSPWEEVKGAPPVRGEERIIAPKTLEPEIDALNARVGELQKQIDELDAVTDARKRGQLEAELADVSAQQGDALFEFLGGGSDAGLQLGVFAQRVATARTQTGILRAIERGIDGSLSRSDIAELKDLKLWKTDDKGAVVSKDDVGIADWMIRRRSRIAPGSVEFLVGQVRAGMLSALFSGVRPLLGGAGNLISQTAGSPARLATDRMMRWMVNRFGDVELRKTFSYAQPSEQARAMAVGALEGVRQIPRTILRGTRGLDELGGRLADEALDRSRDRLYESGYKVPDFIGRYFEDGDVAHIWQSVWHNLQAAMDTPFRRSAANRVLAEQAALAGEELGLKGKELRQFIRARVAAKDPGDMILALDEARYAVSQQDSAINDVIQGIRSGPMKGDGPADLQRTAARAMVGLTFPFSRTPSAIISRALNATPAIGQASLALDAVNLYQLAKGLAPNGTLRGRQIEQMERIVAEAGRKAADQLAVASGIGLTWGVAAGMDLALEGLVTGPVPSDQQEAEEFWRQNKRPFHIKIGDEWRSLAQMPPVGYALAMGAAMVEAQKEVQMREQRGDAAGGTGEAFLEGTGSLAGVGVSLAAESPFFQGPAQISDAISNTRGGRGRWLARSAGSFVPNLLASTANTLDPTDRLKRRDETTDAIGDEIISRIPFLRSNLPAEFNAVTGEETARFEGGLGRRLFSVIDPFGSIQSAPDQDDLLQALTEIGVLPSETPRLEGESEREHNERVGVEQKEVASALRAFLNMEGGDSEALILAMAGPDATVDDIVGASVELARERANFERIVAMAEDGGITPEIQDALNGFINRIVTGVRSKHSRERDPVATIEADQIRQMYRQIQNAGGLF